MTKVNELTQMKKNLEQKHQEKLEDLKSKLTIKDGQFKNAINIQDKLEKSKKEMEKEVNQSAKHALTLETELI